MMQFGYILLNRGRYYSVFPKILLVVLSRILLNGILEDFACNMLTLQDNIDIIFESIAC